MSDHTLLLVEDEGLDRTQNVVNSVGGIIETNIKILPGTIDLIIEVLKLKISEMNSKCPHLTSFTDSPYSRKIFSVRSLEMFI